MTGFAEFQKVIIGTRNLKGCVRRILRWLHYLSSVDENPELYSILIQDHFLGVFQTVSVTGASMNDSQATVCVEPSSDLRDIATVTRMVALEDVGAKAHWTQFTNDWNGFRRSRQCKKCQRSRTNLGRQENRTFSKNDEMHWNKKRGCVTYWCNLNQLFEMEFKFSLCWLKLLSCVYSIIWYNEFL